MASLDAWGGTAAYNNGAPTSSIQSVMIPRAEKRSLPTPHTVYAVLVTLSVRSWTVFRRYSEFLALHESLVSQAGAPPAPLPPKHAARRTIKVITGLGGLLPQGETSLAAEEALTEQRRIELERYIRAIVASTEAKWRETQEFRAFLEIPKDVQVRTLLNDPADKRGRYVPGSYAQASQRNAVENANTARAPISTTPTTRTFGAPQRAVQESDATRALDDGQLVQSQQQQMDVQDEQLEGLTAVLRRQRAMGLAINQELNEQSELLEGLDSEVDQTQSKMTKAQKQMDRLR